LTFSLFTIRHSVVIIKPEIPTAFYKADLTTFKGSMIPASNILQYLLVAASYPDSLFLRLDKSSSMITELSKPAFFSI